MKTKTYAYPPKRTRFTLYSILKNVYVFTLLTVFALFSKKTLAGNETDSLLLLFKKATSFKEKLEAGNNLIFAARFDHKELAKKTAKDLLNNSNTASFPEEHARLWIRLGIVYDLSNQPDSAIWCNENALSIAGKNKLTKQQASALNNLGLIYWNNQQLEKATSYITKASNAFEHVNDYSNYANTLNNLGLIMDELNKSKKAIYYHKQALKIYILINDRYGAGSAYHNLALAYNNSDSTLFYNKKALTEQNAIQDYYGLAKTYNNLGEYYQVKKQFDSTLYYFKQSLTYQNKAGNLYGKASTLMSLSSCLFQRNQNNNSAFEYIKESEKIANEIGYTKLKWKIYFLLGKIYASKGNYPLSNQYYAKAVSLKDSILNEEMLKNSQQLELRFSVSKKEKALAEQRAANAKNKMLIAEKEVETKNAWLILVIITSIITITTLFLIWNFNRKRLKKEQQFALALANEKEKGLHQSITAQENERQRIAKDLHDGVVQNLSVIKMNVEHLKQVPTDKANQNIDEIKLKLAKAAEEVREISHQMMPSALEKLGLIEALHDTLEKALPPHYITYEFHHFGIKQRFDAAKEICLYRVCQELIQNVIKHSKAKHVSISLNILQGFITLHFEDNGVGFPSGIVHEGIGLGNLNSRVKMLKGELKIESTEKKGTLTIVKLPV